MGPQVQIQSPSPRRPWSLTWRRQPEGSTKADRLPLRILELGLLAKLEGLQDLVQVFAFHTSKVRHGELVIVLLPQGSTKGEDEI